jgi:2-keto-3-deoxy-L-rhamnonate aldolase RhmA
MTERVVATEQGTFMETVRNLARERLERGELSLGVGIRLARTVEVAKAMKTAGFDWLFIDLEHGSLTLDTACQIAVGALDAGLAPIVRVPNGEYSMATRALDNGALGIVIPHVDSAVEAREVVEKLKYPPDGHRSVGGGMPQFDFRAVKIADLTQSLNAATLLVVMLETPRAIGNAKEIAAVPGIDVLLIGTNDLCAEMGIPGDFANERVIDAYDKTVAACRAHGKWAGMGGIYDEQLMPRYIERGVRFVLAGADLSFMLAAASRRTAFLRDLKHG